MYYFAYGSNMCSARLRARIPVGECLGRVLLPGYDLYCDKRSQVDDSGKFTIVPSHLDRVPGVLFRISDTALDRLDAFEGPGYRRLHVQVDSTDHGVLDALTYTALDEVREPGLRPYGWYLAFAVAGAREHELPRAHIHRLQQWPVWADPDRERDALNREVLDSATL